jgi:hypothetical protein
MLVAATFSMTAGSQVDPGDKAVAESLFQEGRALIESGQTAAACRKFEESHRLDKAPGTLLNMAHCHKLEGRIATAWSEFFQVAAEARRDGRADREQIALDAIKELEPRIPKLVILVPPESRIEGIKVTRNGTELGKAAWGTETPVDPGEIVIVAEAPGYKPWTRTLDVREGGREQVAIPVLVELPKVEEPIPSAGTPARPVSVPVDTGSPTSQTIGLVLGGMGIVGIGVGSYFGVQAIKKRSDSEDRCTLGPDGNGCSEEAVKLNQDAKDAARIANLGIGIGVVAVLAGTYLYFDGAPKQPETGSGVDVGFGTLPGGAFATVRGGW